MTDTKVLVVFYSRGGTTRRAAQAVRDALGCDLEEIVDTRDRRGVLGCVRSLVDAALRRPSTIAPIEHDPNDYDLVVVGSPVWGFSVSGPVRTYLRQQTDRLPDVAFFCTRILLGGAPALRRMAELAGKQPRAALALRMSQVLWGDPSARIQRFVEGLGV